MKTFDGIETLWVFFFILPFFSIEEQKQLKV